MSESIGAALKAAREKQRLTLAEVSEATRVRTHYLQALENDDLSVMPSAAQGRGFLRLYARHLGLDLDSLIPAAGSAAPEPAAPAPEVDTKPARTHPEETKPPGPGLISRLRERLIKPKPDGSTAPSGPEADSDGKKKALN